MKVSVDDIRKKFVDLINETSTFSDVELWGGMLTKLEDDGLLIYEPSYQEDVIWYAISFFLGLDIKVSPNQNLHSIDDVIWEFSLFEERCRKARENRLKKCKIRESSKYVLYTKRSLF